MRKIIDEIMYDTDTAEHICGYSTRNEEDPDYKKEDLYRKKNGEFFLLGRGGENTEYAFKGLGAFEYYCPNFDYKIIPISENIAKEFVEAIGDAETYIRLFGDVTE